MLKNMLQSLNRILALGALALIAGLLAPPAVSGQSPARAADTVSAQPTVTDLHRASPAKAADPSIQRDGHSRRRWWIIAAVAVAVTVVAIILIRRKRLPACAANGCATTRNDAPPMRAGPGGRIAATE